MTITYPADQFTNRNIENLSRFIYSKQTLLRRVFDIDDLTFHIENSYIHFPWFPDTEDIDEHAAYSDFVQRLCRRVLSLKYVKALDRPLANERYQGSVFLISLKMGEKNRHILLHGLSGDYSYVSMRKVKEAGWMTYAQRKAVRKRKDACDKRKFISSNQRGRGNAAGRHAACLGSV